MAQWLTNPTRNHEVVNHEASLSRLEIWCCRGLWCGLQMLGLDPELLWLWCRLPATAPTGPLAWEPPYAAGAALEMTKRQKKKNASKTSGGETVLCHGSWEFAHFAHFIFFS